MERQSKRPIKVTTCDPRQQPSALRYAIRASSWVNAIFGLIRSEALAKTRLFPTYPGGDYTVLAELALQGKFVEVPELLFQRRLHPEASSQNTDNPDFEARLWTASEQKTFPVWSRSKDNFSIVMRSKLSVWQKLSLSGSVYADHGHGTTASANRVENLHHFLSRQQEF